MNTVRERAPQAIERVVRWVTIVVLGVVALAPLVGNSLRVANWDPQFMRVVVERTHAAGGTYYQNAIHNKGILEPFVYDMVMRIAGSDGFWIGISVVVTLVSLLLGYSAARTAGFTGGIRELQIAAGAVVFVHFALSGADYSGVLYARNMNIALLAAAFTMIFSAWPWATEKRARWSSIATGLLLGIAVQNVLSTAFAVAAIGGGALYVLALREREHERESRNALWMVGAGAFAVIAPIPWYFLRGSLHEYWSGWWVHARFMSIGTGRTLGEQLALGWDSFYLYYQERSAAALLIVAFVLAVMAFWSQMDRLQRCFHLVLLGWFAGGWLEMILNQRYSSHQFAVTSAPTALMGAALAGHAYRVVFAGRERPRLAYAWPLVATVLAVWLSGPTFLVDALERTSRFTTIDAYAGEIEANRGGPTKSVQAVLDLVSENGDPLLASTNEPWPYLDYRRFSATRFIWDSFLAGEIYLGETSDKYILPDTDKWFAEDLEDSPSTAYLEVERPAPPGTVLESYVADNYTHVFENSAGKVSYLNSIAESVLDPDADERWRPIADQPDQTSWTVRPGMAEWKDNGTDRVADALPLTKDSCFALSGSLEVPPGDTIGVSFRMRDNAATENEVAVLAIDAAVTRSSTDIIGDDAGAALIEELPSSVDTSGPIEFSIVVGRRAAVLVVNGQIRSAVSVADSTSLSVGSERGVLTLANLALGPAPEGSGC